MVVRVLSLAERINRNRYPGTCGGQNSVFREEDKEEQIFMKVHEAARVLSSWQRKNRNIYPGTVQVAVRVLSSEEGINRKRYPDTGSSWSSVLRGTGKQEPYLGKCGG